MHYIADSSKLPYEADAIKIPILQIREPRPKKGK